MHGPTSRQAVGVIGGLGVLLALPLLVFPVLTVSQYRSVGPGSDLPQFQQSVWSWGRVADTTPLVDSQFDVSNPVGLVLAVVSLTTGLVGALLYACAPRRDGGTLGSVGLAWAACHLVQSLGQRAGEVGPNLLGEDPGVGVRVLPAGFLGLASAVLFLAAVAAIAYRPATRVVRRGVLRVEDLARRVTPMSVRTGTEDRPARRAGGPGVGFTDEPESSSNQAGSG